MEALQTHTRILRIGVFTNRPDKEPPETFVFRKFRCEVTINLSLACLLASLLPCFLPSPTDDAGRSDRQRGPGWRDLGALAPADEPIGAAVLQRRHPDAGGRRLLHNARDRRPADAPGTQGGSRDDVAMLRGRQYCTHAPKIQRTSNHSAQPHLRLPRTRRANTPRRARDV